MKLIGGEKMDEGKEFKYWRSIVSAGCKMIWGGGVWVQFLESQGARARITLALRGCIWRTPAVSLVLPTFDATGSMGSPPSWVAYPPGSTLSDCIPELKPTTFSSILVFRVFLSFLFS